MRRWNERLIDVATPPSVAIADRVRALRAQGIKTFQMQTGEPAFDTPEYIKLAAFEALNRGETHYCSSQGLPDLRQAISTMYFENYGYHQDPAFIVVGAGAIHSIYCVLTALLNPGDEIIIPEPYWPQYAYIARLAGAHIVPVDTRENGGRLTPSFLRSAVSPRTRVVILNNPVNPTGVVYSCNELKDLIDITDAHFVFDEVYDRFTYTDRFCSILQLDLSDAVRKRTSYVNSFSKSFAMTGWRLGYAFVPEWLLESVLKVSQVTITNATTFVQSAAVSAIVNRQTYQSVFDSMHALYLKRFRELGAILNERGQEFVVPEGAFYYFIRCGQDADRFATSILESERIAVVPGSAYGKYYKDFYRISFAVDGDSYAGYLSWLKQEHPYQKGFM